MICVSEKGLDQQCICSARVPQNFKVPQDKNNKTRSRKITFSCFSHVWLVLLDRCPWNSWHLLKALEMLLKCVAISWNTWNTWNKIGFKMHCQAMVYQTWQELEATGGVCPKRLSLCHAQFFYATNMVRIFATQRTLPAVAWHQSSGFLSHKLPLWHFSNVMGCHCDMTLMWHAP